MVIIYYDEGGPIKVMPFLGELCKSFITYVYIVKDFFNFKFNLTITVQE